MRSINKEASDMLGGCHGTDKLKTPTLDIKICPQCGNEIELFSIDTEMACDSCGYVVYNDIQSCVKWCKYAKLCVGEELYNKLMKADHTVN
jgi:NADH pyrophosphatase NudC (nudix superfamily)